MLVLVGLSLSSAAGWLELEATAVTIQHCVALVTGVVAVEMLVRSVILCYAAPVAVAARRSHADSAIAGMLQLSWPNFTALGATREPPVRNRSRTELGTGLHPSRRAAGPRDPGRRQLAVDWSQCAGHERARGLRGLRQAHSGAATRTAPASALAVRNVATGRIRAGPGDSHRLQRGRRYACGIDSPLAADTGRHRGSAAARHRPAVGCLPPLGGELPGRQQGQRPPEFRDHQHRPACHVPDWPLRCSRQASRLQHRRGGRPDSRRRRPDAGALLCTASPSWMFSGRTAKRS